MADVELVIKIPSEVYENIISATADDNDISILLLGIHEATPLPKGHNILDENKVVMELVYGNLLKDDVKCGDITSILKDARIMKADKESEEPEERND